jgi:signal transduction histidine kinase
VNENRHPSRLHQWLNNIPIQDPVNRQMAALLQVMLLGLLALFITATGVNLFLTTDPYEALIQGVQFSVIFSIPLILLRRGYFRISVFYIIAPFLILVTASIFASNLRSEAETLIFFTLAILLAGLLIDQRALVFTFAISAMIVLFYALREQDPTLRLDYIAIAGNFILLNGLMSIFINSFGIVLRNSLKSSLQREEELKNEIKVRKQAESALGQLMERLEIMHEIDRSLLSARSTHDIAVGALARIRQLIPCPRASVTLFDFDKNEAMLLAADFEEMEAIPEGPISLEEYGLRIIDALRQNEPWMTDDILSEPDVTALDRRIAVERGVRAWLYLPLLTKGRLIGGLNLGRRAGSPFTPEDAEIAHDVANQLAIALEQTNLYNALHRELKERKKLIADLEAINSELERFTYTVSHDLRNPLVTIKGFLGMLEKDIRENQKEKIQSDLERIASAADKMNELLSDLLELSRVGRILNPPETIDLVSLTRDALESIDARIRARGVSVEISPDLPSVVGDRIRLREVFENLIDNAVKYLGDQPEPRIEIGVRNQDSSPVLFVRDNGIGIEPKYQSKIFTLFEKLDPAIEGTGIGLALVKRIIETHGGRIWVDSDGPGRGSTFCFTLPPEGVDRNIE